MVPMTYQIRTTFSPARELIRLQLRFRMQGRPSFRTLVIIHHVSVVLYPPTHPTPVQFTVYVEAVLLLVMGIVIVRFTWEMRYTSKPVCASRMNTSSPCFEHSRRSFSRFPENTGGWDFSFKTARGCVRK
ncbi:hypothetical protein NPIL_178651 [Nephila pilipes]|uniref:Transmembrane protein n=1 Tax=Nephila pilipes TaxID=299642 RepID=A0A8X6N4W3_NEPPI|nr:hypothetical protein NPIL_178651 [Nephila pilipes]